MRVLPAQKINKGKIEKMMKKYRDRANNAKSLQLRKMVLGSYLKLSSTPHRNLRVKWVKQYIISKGVQWKKKYCGKKKFAKNLTSSHVMKDIYGILISKKECAFSSKKRRQNKEWVSEGEEKLCQHKFTCAVECFMFT